ncbi:RlpA-like double-psi beta-barrel-protein domain-containing protein-containing protein [Dichomitus squalens]|uniref:RlpA-like double-psi beta-barrel-protein domain-containing protein-containing protein n=1 Tax=Dichomitus squalens TaxID=114155 RepID=A0A4Q9Q428_9APHY|nr:RlpA-like double-psi beta-barrel-protein domain-containing protein-containing protein [Dichomitus squalens]TBU47435.1 RlpA-like double-psi beta-barrel-protein domain-containing protein-containing protein [Dichomitus squalens]TBU61929.1 RlpA-like double-psi beta-barrel-protein domain-containing protein-containing protein [Dichomitus squalens]
MSPFTAIAFFLALSATAFAAPTSEGTASVAKRSRTGRGTWFDVGLGACGETNVNSDKIIAISADIYGNGGYCNKGVTITNTANGKTATAIVRDECPGCGANDIDMSPSLFQELGSLDTGVLTVSWDFN